MIAIYRERIVYRMLSLSAAHSFIIYYYHFSDVIMGEMASQINGVSSVYSTVCSGADRRKHQSSSLLAFVRGIYRWAMNSLHKGPVTRQMFPFDDVIMISRPLLGTSAHILLHTTISQQDWKGIYVNKSKASRNIYPVTVIFSFNFSYVSSFPLLSV